MDPLAGPEAQIFTAGLTGLLDQVDVAIGTSGACMVTVEIRTVSGAPAVPTNVVLASASLTYDGAVAPALTAIRFSNPSAVVAGTQYAIVLSAPTPCGLVGEHTGNPYPRGHNAFFFAGEWTSDTGSDLAFRTYVVVAPPPPPPPTANCAGQVATQVGTEGNDIIEGTPGRDVIAALGGKDLVRGLAGNDRLCGGRGKDALKGGGGKDRLKGGAGADVLKGGGGTDRCAGGAGGDSARKCEVEQST